MSHYDTIIAQALKGCLKAFLSVSHGMYKEKPTTHIEVDLTHKDVQVSEFIKTQFDSSVILCVDGYNIDFHAGDKGFSVKYSINDKYEEFYIPYDAIKSFSDSSVDMLIKFEGGSVEQQDYVEEQPLVEEVQTDAAASTDKVCSLAAWKKSRGKELTDFEKKSL